LGAVGEPDQPGLSEASLQRQRARLFSGQARCQTGGASGIGFGFGRGVGYEWH